MNFKIIWILVSKVENEKKYIYMISHGKTAENIIKIKKRE